MSGVGEATGSRFVRLQSPESHPCRPVHLGVFALVNGLRAAGALTEREMELLRVHHAWYDAAYPNPSTIDPYCYDRDRHPTAAAWFRTSATELLARVHPYLEMLRAHNVGLELLSSDVPGRVVYEDAYQVVVVQDGPRRPGSVRRRPVIEPNAADPAAGGVLHPLPALQWAYPL